MKLPATHALHAYWLSLCQGRCAPERSALDPVAMRHMLAQTFLLDVDAEPGATPRLPIHVSGTRLDALFGRDLRGAAFADLWSAPDRRLVREIAGAVGDGSQPAVLGGCAAPGGAQRLLVEVLLLPLRHGGRTHARMLGSLAFAGTPTWLGLRAADALELTSWRMLEGSAPRPEPATAQGSPTMPGRRYAHLIVHEGGARVSRPEEIGRQAHVKPAVSRWTHRR